jgi:hypothetical protein
LDAVTPLHPASSPLAASTTARNGFDDDRWRIR